MIQLRLLKQLVLASIFFTLFTMAQAQTQTVIFYLEDEPVYTNNSSSNPGFLLEIALKIAAELKLKTELKFTAWRRAQQNTQRVSNAMIFPLTRTAHRDPHYKWVCKIMDVPVMFITKEGKPVINNIEQAKTLYKIGVIKGTPQERYLKEAGLRFASLKGKVIYRALETGRIDALYGAQPEAVAAWKNGGYHSKLQFGKTIQTLPLWVAANLKSPQVHPQDWQQALERLKQKGVYQEAYQYYFKP